jgi:hypothetical protein
VTRVAGEEAVGGRRGRSAAAVAALVVLAVGCGGGADTVPVAVPEGDLSGEQLRAVVEELAAVHDVPQEQIPSSPTFAGGGTAVVTACFLAVDVLRAGQDQDPQVVLPRLDLVSDMAVGHEQADTVREGLATVRDAIEDGDSVAFALGTSDVLEACSAILGR